MNEQEIKEELRKIRLRLKKYESLKPKERTPRKTTNYINNAVKEINLTARLMKLEKEE